MYVAVVPLSKLEVSTFGALDSVPSNVLSPTSVIYFLRAKSNVCSSFLTVIVITFPLKLTFASAVFPDVIFTSVNT